MGTHPIFESDFDCLTDLKKMNSEVELPTPYIPKPDLLSCETSNNLVLTKPVIIPIKSSQLKQIETQQKKESI